MAEEAIPGTVSTADGQLMRRTSCNFTLTGQKISNDENRPSNQNNLWFLGPRQTSGTLSGELSCGSCSMLFEGLLRRKFSPGVNVQGLVGGQITPTGANAVLSATAMTFFGNGIRVGDIIRIYGAQTSSVNGANFLVVLSGNSLTLAGGDLSNINGLAPYEVSAYGVKTYIPKYAQLSLSYTLEQQFTDIGRYEVYNGCYIQSMSLSATPTGMVKFSAQLVGFNISLNSGPTYQTPAALFTTKPLVSAGGFLSANGVLLASVTSFSVNIANQTIADARAGSDYLSAIFLGNIQVTGQFSAFLASADPFSGGFLAETQLQLSLLFTDSNASGANFIALKLPNIRLTDLSPQDSQTAIVRTYSFVALEQTTDATNDLTTIAIQDSIGPANLTNPAADWVFGESAFGIGAF